MNAIEVDNLTKLFEDFTAVDHLDFEVKNGEIFGFLGPNGAGKTTTVRMLTGIIKPDLGQVSIMGHDIRQDPIKAKQIMGVVPELSNAYTELTALNNLQFMAELYGVPKKDARQRAEELLGKFDLYERKDHKVRTFSKGMKQKLIIAMSLMNNPEILFLDEPTSGLDVMSARLIKDMLLELNKEGKTIFLTTHYMEEANQLCSRVAIINHGKIAAIDAPEKLKMRIGGLEWVEVSFDMPVDASDFSDLSGVIDVRISGDKLRLYTNEPGMTIYQLVDYSRSNDLEIVMLNTLTPTLEDVFIKLTEEME
ncbi:MAG: ATP-binding cassette domain-containing protein [ANME-2 cluster archaeon]|nr:ATP-binding cassette domain-containing protein [ANME-2 cluster archaeon]MBC2702501.1 ATP-binding cassette domain-containing protein [ANME-2 cluster archaeon]MBC2706792.1 ATP-binding cassette domain-containing protein [ANME-2 cluster archaeon]MBC2747630.1 ATP-binding cassette domain-containing protein [ANME-2 cluster archaeon]MBC2762575.1 ATP-binding cassette domain-containing protein [ANME-2 cluster archaeon]